MTDLPQTTEWKICTANWDLLATFHFQCRSIYASLLRWWALPCRTPWNLRLYSYSESLRGNDISVIARRISWKGSMSHQARNEFAYSISSHWLNDVQSTSIKQWVESLFVQKPFIGFRFSLKRSTSIFVSVNLCQKDGWTNDWNNLYCKMLSFAIITPFWFPSNQIR